MSIKMRTIKESDAICKICGNEKKSSLEIFEIMFTDKAKITICDLCNEELLHKTLVASCRVQGKIKNKKDLEIIRKRNKKEELKNKNTN